MMAPWLLALLCVSALTAQATKPDSEPIERALLLSQAYLLAAGAGKIATNSARQPAQSTSSAAGSIGLLATSIALERILQKHWTRRTKTIVIIANFAGGTILAGYIHSHAKANREELRRLRGMLP